jgi:tRNA pseudouridine38-40 synthase
VEVEKKLLKTIKLTIEYDGSPFSGWQVQPKHRTVQEEIETALKKITKETIRITGSGRTDSGVHALGQVASFQIKKDMPISAYEKGLNTVLPKTIRILRAEAVHFNFDARRDAVSRTYRYILSKYERAIGYQYNWFPDFQFNINVMKKASVYLKGEHSFRSFCRDDGERSDCISHVFRIRWEEREQEIQFEITAVRFFHNMIRIIVGTLLEVGRGKMTLQQFRNLINQKDRTLAGPTVPPNGLFLVRVDYS